MKKKFYKDGLRFKCKNTGKCCKSGKIDGYVYMTLEDRRRVAGYLKLATQTFTKQYLKKTRKKFHLRKTKHDCIFLVKNRCSIYEVRPSQCRTWPFWPENMKKHVWEKEIKKSCPGIGEGKLYTMCEIEKILATQRT